MPFCRDGSPKPAATHPLGPRLLRRIYTGARADGSEFTEDDAPNFTFRQNNCSFYSGTEALGEEIRRCEKLLYRRLHIPDHRESPRNYLTKLMRYQRLLQAENSISQLEEFVASTFACWEKKIPYGIYNVTNPGYVSTQEVVELISKRDLQKADAGTNPVFSKADTRAQQLHMSSKPRHGIEAAP